MLRITHLFNVDSLGENILEYKRGCFFLDKGEVKKYICSKQEKNVCCMIEFTISGKSKFCIYANRCDFNVF